MRILFPISVEHFYNNAVIGWNNWIFLIELFSLNICQFKMPDWTKVSWESWRISISSTVYDRSYFQEVAGTTGSFSPLRVCLGSKTRRWVWWWTFGLISYWCVIVTGERQEVHASSWSTQVERHWVDFHVPATHVCHLPVWREECFQRLQGKRGDH